ncbi:2-dehydropantoate 2-reductase [Rhodanobacter glycinis]|uniref:2-dehydropantoate 2-reductase n=1 Tax=Rhodanobacter glycinis TaxID=582702 RepID=A0A502FQ24_9GAMM|nr:2-dehydropantoate 2-reductase [Rhodanobacter glycinis]TPG10547.1 2-dehydropantoate 2-reductase [Rhodanobacter glycinis]TPG51246.1 2-dehydropantoate 2-reductase [Rhodanobacter glycinis]
MRILIVGAGATGGYFGGRLLQHGRDVTFLVREQRAAQLARTGLVIRSASGDAQLPAPRTVLASELRQPYDLILLSCKAYGLEQAMADVAPAVGPHTAILPLLNGMRQLDLLDARFGAPHVLGGQCVIAATLDAQGAVQHLNQSHSLTFGERDGSASERMQRITSNLTDSGFDARPSATILQDMWDKWIFLASLAGITCLLRGSVGSIAAAPGGSAAALALLEECRAVAEHAGHAPGEATLQRARHVLTEAGSTLTASMLRDLQHGHAIEADHVVGDMLARADPQHAAPVLLSVVYAHLKVYEAGRMGEQRA